MVARLFNRMPMPARYALAFAIATVVAAALYLGIFRSSNRMPEWARVNTEQLAPEAATLQFNAQVAGQFPVGSDSALLIQQFRHDRFDAVPPLGVVSSFAREDKAGLCVERRVVTWTDARGKVAQIGGQLTRTCP